MANKRHVSARDVLQDIQAGMLDDELRRKYGLSEKDLKVLFEKLVSALANG